MLRQTVPVQVDTIKFIEGFERARCIYYRVEFASDIMPAPPMDLRTNRAQYIAWIGFSVLTGPSQNGGDGELFSTWESIERTLASIEDDALVSLDLAHVWLPNESLGITGKDHGVRSGDVFRVHPDVFSMCYRFMCGTISEDAWLNACRTYSDYISPSPKETEAFRRWRKECIENTRKRYHSDDYVQFRLAKLEDDIELS